MNKIFKVSLTLFAIVAGTLLLMAGAGTGPRYVGRFYGNGLGLSNAVDLVAGPNINITIGPGNRSFTLESTAAGAAGIFTNSIMGYGDQYRTNYVRINTNGVTVTGGSLISDRLVVLDGAASNYIGGDTTFIGSLFIAGVESSGTIFTYDVFQGNGISITNLDGTEIRSGTVADARIASTIARDSEVTTATQNSTNAGNIAFLPANNVFTGTSNHFNGAIGAARFAGSAAGLTNIPGIVSVADYGGNTNNAAAVNKVAFQKAIDSLTNQVYSGYFGGIVSIPPGWWDIAGPIQVPPGVHLVGAGSKATALAFTKYLVASNGIEFVTGDTYNYVPEVGIKGLSVILTSDSVAGDGIHLETQDDDSYIRPEIDDVVVRGGWRYGMYIEDVMGGYCMASAVYNATNAGFYLNQFCNNFNLMGNYSKQNGDAGFKLGMNGGLVSANGADGNTNAGFWLTEDCIGTTFLGNTSEQNYTNQWLIEANDAGIDIINCSSSQYATAEGNGFYFNNAKGVRLLNPDFWTTADRKTNGGYGIFISGTSTDNQVSRTTVEDQSNFGSGVINDWTKLSKYEVDGRTWGIQLQDVGANIPTNAVPLGSATVTNWWYGVIGGIPTLVATNYAVGGWIQKDLFP